MIKGKEMEGGGGGGGGRVKFKEIQHVYKEAQGRGGVGRWLEQRWNDVSGAST